MTVGLGDILAEVGRVRRDVLEQIGAIRTDVSKCDGRISSLSQDIAAVSADIQSLRRRVEGEDGEGGLCAQVHDMQMDRARETGVHNGLQKGASSWIKVGIAIGFVLAGLGARDVVGLLSAILRIGG